MWTNLALPNGGPTSIQGPAQGRIASPAACAASSASPTARRRGWISGRRGLRPFRRAAQGGKKTPLGDFGIGFLGRKTGILWGVLMIFQGFREGRSWCLDIWRIQEAVHERGGEIYNCRNQVEQKGRGFHANFKCRKMHMQYPYIFVFLKMWGPKQMIPFFQATITQKPPFWEDSGIPPLRTPLQFGRCSSPCAPKKRRSSSPSKLWGRLWLDVVDRMDVEYQKPRLFRYFLVAFLEWTNGRRIWRHHETSHEMVVLWVAAFPLSICWWTQPSHRWKRTLPLQVGPFSPSYEYGIEVKYSPKDREHVI